MRRTRRSLPTLLAAVLLLSTGTPEPTSAQSITDAIVDVLEWLEEGYDLVPEQGQWGLVFGWFSQGEQKELHFTATAEQSYMIVGGGDLSSADLDICVYDPYGREIDCDVMRDNYPMVEFTAEVSGTYRAVLLAYELTGYTSYAGMAVLRERW